MTPYIGRFAPSPSGPLHFGSLIAATASYLDAISQNGKWLVRIDDIDTPRVVAGASDTILLTLEMFGFEWCGEVVYQSQRHELYLEALHQLQQQSHAFVCDCRRKQIFSRHNQGVYDGFCRKRELVWQDQHSVRFKTTHSPQQFDDLIQGLVQLDPLLDLGDFVLRRSDGIMGYHLVCAVDDLAQGVTHVIRGSDLLESSFAQRQVTQALVGRTLYYGHHPIAINRDQIKLSKSAQSAPIEPKQASQQLWQALHFLQQQPPDYLAFAPLTELWQWAKQHWQRHAIPACRKVEVIS